ncbi:hypothetical protein BOTBODRAFT_147208 [Botryobasidium botryosum FD-172 SS1]|uniref:Uncharacterized protein n=1 Tax=Botryobasidium botryosum (strain FD-172 SS1) TaxID=930990 RepID=A0A067M6U7_BOTB1|nr:hypothetical protein BOTBODRAFT_147208 [Botryobasidium botryosum FD-172 SS1]
MRGEGLSRVARAVPASRWKSKKYMAPAPMRIIADGDTAQGAGTRTRRDKTRHRWTCNRSRSGSSDTKVELSGISEAHIWSAKQEAAAAAQSSEAPVGHPSDLGVFFGIRIEIPSSWIDFHSGIHGKDKDQSDEKVQRGRVERAARYRSFKQLMTLDARTVQV